MTNDLTKKQMDVLYLMCCGYYISEIAEKLGVSISTVKTRRKKILDTFDVGTPRDMVAYAIRHRLLEGYEYKCK